MFEPSIELYDDQVNNDFTVAILQLIFWAVLARRLYRLPFSKTAHKLRRSSRRLVVGVVVGALLVPARLFTILVMGGYGPQFAADRLWIGLPLVAVPTIFALVLTLPRLRRFAVAEVADRQAPPTPEQRLRAAAPAVTLPARAVTIGALIAFARLIFAPTPPLFIPALLTFAVAGGWILVLGRRHRARTAGVDVRPMPSGGARTRRNLVGTVTVLALVAVYAAWDWQTSKLPDSYSMMDHAMTYGDGPEVSGHGHLAVGASGAKVPSVSVADLTGPRTGVPDKRFTLTATDARMKLSSSAEVDAVVFNGQLPGPELRVREGDLVEVTLVNRTRDVPTTLHWHGVDVPNAEDGVAGVTQDAVAPGKSHTYRWVAGQTGTYWYHSHQQSSVQVRRGLFGPLVIEKADPGPANLKEFTLAAHVWDTDKGEISSLNSYDTLRRETVPAGTPVRIRLVNSDNFLKTFTLAGVPFKVTALDGNDVNAPTELSKVKLPLGGGGRYDLEFVMPAGPVRFADLAAPDAGLLITPDGKGELAPLLEAPDFDPTRYGSPRPTPFGPGSDFDRSFQLILDNKPGFFDGTPYYLWTVNGSVFPHIPMLMVREGELVKVTVVNRSFLEHPLHLHGHRVLVLSRNGKPVTGSPVWLDTVTVVDGETYELAFKADNPGVWMDHCHNLGHAAMGMTIHLAYENVHTPYLAGRATGNVPE